MKVICVTGMRGCGKTVFGDVAMSKGYPVYEMRSIVVEMMNRDNIEINNRNMREYAKRIREEYGKDVVARRMVDKIMQDGADRKLVIVVGVRGMYEVRKFKEEFGGDNVILLAIHAPPKARFERVMRRTSKVDDPQGYEEFLWSEEMELGYGVSKAIALADIMLVNDKSIDEYLEECGRVLDDLAR